MQPGTTCWIYHVTFTSRRMKREISSILSIPLGSAESLYISSEKKPVRRKKNLIKMRTRKGMTMVFPISIPLW